MRRKIILSLVSCVVIIGLLSAFTPFGVYKAYETRFSPDTFTFRATQHFELCGLQISPRSTSEWSLPLIDYLRVQGHIEDEEIVHPRWHFVHGMKPGVRGWMGNAKDAYRSFRQDHLIDWSKENPVHAKYIWPKVVALTQTEKYYLVRVIFMELSDFDGSVDDLRQVVALAENSWEE